MADGKTHVRYTVYTSVVTALAAGVISQDVGLTITAATGCLTGIFISPDLDLHTVTISEALVYRIPLIGWFLGPLFFYFWYPYGRIMKHRSFWSHFPVIGTVLRLVYSFALLSPIINLYLLNGAVFIPSGDLFNYTHYGVFWFIGLVYADTAHWLADHI